MAWCLRATAILLLLGAMIGSASPQPAPDRSGETCPTSDDQLLGGDPIADMEPLAQEYQQRGRTHFNLGQYPQALASFDCATKLTERFLSRIKGFGPIFERYEANRAELHNDIGNVHMEMHRHGEALQSYSIAYFLARDLVARTAGSPLRGNWLTMLIGTQSNVAGVLCAKGEVQRCLREYESAMVVARGLPEKQKEGLEQIRLQVVLHRVMSEAYSVSGDEKNAHASDLDSLLILERHLKRYPNDNEARSEFLHAHARIGRRGGAGACEHLKEVSKWMTESEDDKQASDFRGEMAKIVNPAMEKQNCK